MLFCNRNLFLLYTLAVASFEPIEATISRRVQTKSEGCVAQAVAWLPEDPRNAPENFKHLTFECELDPIDAKGEIGRMLELDLTAKQEEEFKSLMANGVFIPNSSILTFNSNSDVFGTSGDVEVFEDIIRIPPGVTISSFLRKGTRPDNRQRNRRLGDQFGDSPTLVIKTIDTSGRTVPQTIQELSNNVFGPESEDAINARNQFFACSAGKFDLSPGNFGHEDNPDHTPGVIEVNIDISLVGQTQSAIRSAILTAANAKLGLSLPGQYEFTLYTIEDCDGCGWAAYAYYNSHLSMYRKNYASYPAVVLHELGHNFGLGHSGETVTYDDHSCLMGNPLFGFDLAKMCYNAAKSWQIGWYADAEVDYKPTVIGNESWTGQLVGVAQYSHADRDGRPVTLRIDSGSTNDYFINFNRKIGMTSQNKEGSDLVNVYEQDGNGESTGNASKILKNLNEGDEWTKANFGNSGKTLSIKVNEIVLGDESIIGYADVTICLGTCNFGSPSISPSPTDAPSGSSSLRPTLISSSPTGNPTSSFSPTTEEDYKDYQFEVGSSNGQTSKTVELLFDNMVRAKISACFNNFLNSQY
uniref:Peptidase M11 gametolysin domain-containing protein n=1 Tax=Chaetoceros debilis TaxID=122233 RepID=A0A7S3QHF5_9STRA